MVRVHRSTLASKSKQSKTKPSTTTSALRTIELSPTTDHPENEMSNKARQELEAGGELHSSGSPQDNQPDFRLAIDFGTKFTSIACTMDKGTEGSIFIIEEFPNDPMPYMAGTQVPTEIAYLHKKTEQHGEEKVIRKVLYGYEIQSQRDHPDGDFYHFKEVGHITNVKLLLDKSSHLKYLKKSLMDMLKKLRTDGAVQKYEDVIYDLLVCYLRHTKDILQRRYGLLENSEGKASSGYAAYSTNEVQWRSPFASLSAGTPPPTRR